MTPEEVQAWVDAITGSYSDAEISALEGKAHELDVNKVRRWVDSFIDEAGQHFPLEVVLEAMTDACVDLEKALGDDNADN